MAEQVNSASFLPEIFQTEPNKEFFAGSLDVLTSQPDLRRVEGFIGEKYGYGVLPTDKYVVEPSKSRSDYQLEPGVVFLKNDTQKPEDFINYPGLISALKLNGADVTNHDRLFSNEFYSWDPFVDYDKIVNYYNWYWIPGGPDAIPIVPSIVYTTENYDVASDTGGYTFDAVSGTNPAITMLRGGTYTFTVNSGDGPLWIQTIPGVNVTSSERTILGVTNNGTNNGIVSFTVPATALLLADTLYYQNGDDPESYGIIHLVESNEDAHIFVTDIIGKKSYTSPTGIVFTDGLKVIFGSDVTPTEYANNSYYVQGVGSAISLVNVDKYIAVEELDPTELYAPATPQYITIDRNSRDFNAWSRANRWFSKQVVDTTIEFLGSATSSLSNTPIKAQRPIIEYRGNLQLFNSGSLSLGEVNLVDTITTDAFNNIEGKTVNEVGTIDGVLLYNNCKIIFTADVNLTVRQNIYVVKLVPAGPLGEIISLVPDIDLSVENFTQVYISQGASQKGATWWFNQNVNNWIAGQRKYYTNQYPLFDVFNENGYSLSDNAIYSASTFRGTKLFSYTPGTGANDPVLGFPIAYSSAASIGDILFTVNLNSDTFAYNSDQQENIITPINIGFVHWHETIGTTQNLTGWIPAAGESVQYQVFEFPLITNYQYTNNNTSIRIESGGTGYAVGDQLKILGNYIGGKTPENDLYFTVSSVSGSSITGISLDSIKGNSITDQGIFTDIFLDRVSGSGSSGMVSVIISDPGTTTFKCDIPASVTTPWRNVIVYYNDNIISPNEYTVSIDNTNLTTSITVNSTIGAKVTALLISDYTSKNSYYTIPSNLENNPFNSNVTSVAVGDMRNQYLSIFSNAPGVTGTAYGQNNLATLGNVYKYGTAIIQNSSSLVLPGIFLRKPQADIFNALKYSSDQYGIYKNLILDLVNSKDYSIYTTPSSILDDVIFNITSNKKNETAFFWTDMLFSGTPYVQNSYSVGANYTTSATFSIADVWSPELFTKANYNGVGVYVTRTINDLQQTYQLLKNVDYTISTTLPSVIINYQLMAGDVVTIKQYKQTYGSYCPATPSKLGIYPIFIPKIIGIFDTDGSYTVRYWLRGHDGSLNKLYGSYQPFYNTLSDVRDQVLFEFEKRIYNNYKVNSPVPLTVDSVIPGEWRTTEYTWNEILSIYSTAFLNWIGQNRLEYKYQIYNSTDQFTYNYNQTSDKLSNKTNLQGYWKGLYNWLYDTTNPAGAPWEMLGLVNKPTWWDTKYGVGPYTSGNTYMWQDIADGYVWNDGEPYINPNRVRPGLLEALPVNSFGELLSPFAVIVGNYDRLTFNRDWVVGDGAPVENSYLTSSAWPFDAMRLLALTKPAKFFNLFADRDLYKFNNKLVSPGQYLYNDRYHLNSRNLTIYGNGTAKHSYINFVVDYINQYGSNGTDVIQNYISNSDVRLIYNMAGFTAKNYLKFLVEKATPNSQNSSLLIPDENYTVLLYDNPPTEKITFSSVIIQKVKNGYSVYGNSKYTQFFTVQVPKPGLFKTVTTNGISVQLSTTYTNKTINIPYGNVFYSVQSLCEFLQAYGQHQINQGVIFDNISGGVPLTWQTMIEEFIVWSQQGWEIGSIIQVNPNAREFTVNREGLVVQPLTLHDQNFMLNQNLLPIQTQDAAINRNSTAFSVKILSPGDTISLANLNLSSIEHAIVFDNETVFNDTIYNLDTGLRQSRLLLKGYKSGNWNGWMNANGFIINQHNIKEWEPNVKYPKDFIVFFKDKYYVAATLVEPAAEFSKENWLEADYTELKSDLLPNPSTMAYESQWYYDTTRTNLENDADLLSFSLIGYRPRDYLAAADLTDITQINVYQNIIKSKGTKQLADSFKGLTFDQGSIDYNIQENWAIKQGQFGAVLNRNYVEAVLQQNVLTGNPTTIGFGNGSTVDGVQQTVQIDDLINWGRPPLSQYFLPLYQNSYEIEKGISSAGYVNLDDTKIQKYYYSDLVNSPELIKTLYRGENVWIANYKNSWDIFTAVSLNNEITAVNNNLNSTVNLTFLNLHGLKSDDLITVFNIDSRIDGFYKVKAVKDLFTITIAKALDPTVNTLSCQGTGFKLVTRRFEQPSDAANSFIPYSQWNTRKIWADYDVDNQWAVYAASPVYRETYNYQRTGAFGVSVAYSENCGQLIADGAGNIYRYKNGTTQVISSSGIGANVKLLANEDYVYCSSPDDGFVYVYQYNEVTDTLLFSQKITVAPHLATVTGAIAASADSQWLYIADSINQQIAIYALNNLFFNYTFVQTFNDPDVVPGSSWGASLATAIDGAKIVVGAPTENVGAVNSAGATYVYTRFIQSYLADGISTIYNMAYASPNNIIDVYINDVLETTCAASANGTLLLVYTYDPVTDAMGPAPLGTLITVSTGHVFKVQRFQSDNPIIDGLYGSTVDTNRYGADIIVGCPYEVTVKDNNQNIEGAVYHYTNSGQRYGTVTTTITGVQTGTIFVDGFIVNYSGNITQIAQAINTQTPTNIIASVVGTVMTITYKEGTPEWLYNIIDITGEPANLSALGIVPYTKTQKILNVDETNISKFGYTVKMDERDSLVVGAITQYKQSPTTFDYTPNCLQDDTMFDNDSTIFVDSFPNQGVVYNYTYLPAHNESIDNPGQYAFGQYITTKNIKTSTPSPKFGYALAYYRSVVMVGTPDWSATGGGASTFTVDWTPEYPECEIVRPTSWYVDKKPLPVVDINSLSYINIYNLTNNTTLEYLDYIDPLQGKILGAVTSNLDYTRVTDPAIYNTTGVSWNVDHVGNTWLDLSTIRILNYHQPDIAYNAKNWGKAFPGSTADVYVWIESIEPPINYAGPGYPKYFDQYTSSTVVDGSTNSLVTKYYFWVKNYPFIPEGKTLSPIALSTYMLNPLNSGIAFLAPITTNVVSLFNCGEYIQDNSSVLHLGYGIPNTDDDAHTSWSLIREGDPEDFLAGLPTESQIYPQGLYLKFIESFAGWTLDGLGAQVPDPKLPLLVRYGTSFRPTQSMFVDRLLALQNYMTYANDLMIKLPIVEMRNVGLLNTFGFLFDTRKYWQRVNWWTEGYNDSTKPDIEVQNYNQLLTLVNDESYIGLTGIALTLQDGLIAKVSSNAYGNAEYYVYNSSVNPNWTRIGAENSTIQILSTLWTKKFGWSSESWDSVWDANNAKEVSYIVRWLNEVLYTNELQLSRNLSLCLMFKYMQSESLEQNNYLPWLNKTSLIDVQHRIRSLLPYKKYQRDNQDFLSGFLNEIKPYHVYIKDFVYTYNGLDVYQGNISDFDLPAAYNFATGKNESPQLVYTNTYMSNQYTSNDVIWKEQDYNQWFNNYGLSITTETDSLAVTSLRSSLNQVDTTLNVEVIYGFPAQGTVRIEDEIISYTGLDISNKALTGLTRGIDDTTPAIHASGVDVKIVIPPILVYNTGRGYINPPKVNAYINTSIYPFPRTPAVLEPILSGDKLVGVNVVEPGSGYAITPDIIIEGGSISSIFADANINVSNNTITIPSGHNFVNGDSVIYNANSGTTAPAGLIVGGYYYVGVINPTTIALYESYENSTLTVIDPYCHISSDDGRIQFGTTGSGIGNSLTVTARAVCISSDRPIREFKINLKFDRTSYTVNPLENNAAARIEEYYDPTISMPGKELSQLMTGMEYPNAVFKSAAFNLGWDGENWSMIGWDGPSDEPATDTILKDLSFPTQPSEAAVNYYDVSGGTFVSGYGPEEMIPGYITDIMSLNVISYYPDAPNPDIPLSFRITKDENENFTVYNTNPYTQTILHAPFVSTGSYNDVMTVDNISAIISGGDQVIYWNNEYIKFDSYDIPTLTITGLTRGYNGSIVNPGTVSNPVTYPGGTITVGNLVAGTFYTITSVGTTDFTVAGAPSNAVGVTFIANSNVGALTGTGEVGVTVQSVESRDTLDYTLYDKWWYGSPVLPSANTTLEANTNVAAVFLQALSP